MCAQVSARKPEWETGAKAAVSLLGRRAKTGAAPAAPAPAAAVWSMAGDDDEDEELIDDDALLTEEDRRRPAVPCEPLPMRKDFSSLLLA